MVEDTGDPCDDSFDCEGNRHIDEIASQQVCHGGADSCRQQPPDGAKDDAGENDDGVSGVYISAGSRRWDADGHSGNARQRGE